MKTAPNTWVVMEEIKSTDSGQSDMTSRSSIECNFGEVGEVFAAHSTLAFCALGDLAGPTKPQIPKEYCKKLQKVKCRKYIIFTVDAFREHSVTQWSTM